MDMFDFAGMLFGGNRANPDAKTVTATGAAASVDGEVGITLDADVTPAEDTGAEGDADQTIIDLPTSPDVDEGDELIVTLVGDGPLKTPVVTANPGSGDRMRTLVNAAQTVADAAQAVAEAVNQHFFADDGGIHVTEATQEDWDESHTGANVLINSIGQLFRDGLNNLLTLTTESGARALTIWDGLGNSASNILARFSSDGISFADGTSFDIGDSSSYIHFDGDGHINIGGSGLTIGGYIPTGGVTVSDLTQAAQDATLNSNISVGGRNLLTGTGDWSGGVISSSAGTVSGDTFTFAAHDTLDWYAVHLSNPHIPFAEVDGKTLTLSFDYRSDDFSDTTGDHHYIYINATASSVANGSGRTKYRQISTSTFDGVYVPTTEWRRGTITFELSESLLTSGSGACNYFFIQFYDHTLNSLQLRHVKLEVGNMATDWSQAQEDLEAYADESAYLSAKPNLAPLGSAEFSDVYNATTNPDGYWQATVSTWFTQLDDGWIHVYRNNSSGTSAYNSTGFRPSASPSVFAGKAYTILTEIRNNASTGTGTNDLYLQQVANNQFWGNTSGVVIDEDHVTTTTTVSLLTCGQSYVLRSYRIADTDHLTAGTPSPEMFRYNFRVAAGATLDFDFRMSVYEGIYDGPYKPYSGTQLFATQTDASNAAKTATSYVTEITGQNGIMVHPSTDQTTGVQITSDVDILRAGTSVINIGTMGDTDNETDAGVTIYDGDGNESSNILARFTGNRIRLGKHIDDNEENDGAYVDFFDGDWFVNRLDSNVFVRDDPDDPARTLSLGMSTAIEGTFPGTKAFIDASFGASAQVYGDELGAHEQITRSSLSSGTSGRYSSTSMGVVTAETYEIVDGYREMTDSSRQAYIRADELELTYDVGQLATTRTHSIEHVSIVLRSPIGTYTGTNTSATASASGWQLTYFNVVVAENGTPRTYDYTFSNGTLTALRDCKLEISGVMDWTDAIAGNRGFGIFEGTTAGSGTEHSAFQNFPNTISNRKSVVFPPKLFTLTAGSSLTFGRYQQQNAVYQNGTNYSWVTIRVIG